MSEREPDTAEAEAGAVLARVPSAAASGGMHAIENHPEWPTLARVPLLITAGVPLPKFRVRDLLGLAVGQVIESGSASSDDLPVKVGATQFAWSEFEVVGQQMAVRLTRLA